MAKAKTKPDPLDAAWVKRRAKTYHQQADAELTVCGSDLADLAKVGPLRIADRRGLKPCRACRPEAK